MNKQRRQQLTEIYSDMEALSNRMKSIEDCGCDSIEQMANELIDIKTRLEIVLSDEECSFNNRSEGSQATLQGQESENAIDCMYSTIDHLEEAKDYFEKWCTDKAENKWKEYHDQFIEEIDSALDELYGIDFY